jgi:hypothetical protein
VFLNLSLTHLQVDDSQYYDLGGDDNLDEDEDESEFKGEAIIGNTASFSFTPIFFLCLISPADISLAGQVPPPSPPLLQSCQYRL